MMTTTTTSKEAIDLVTVFDAILTSIKRVKNYSVCIRI